MKNRIIILHMITFWCCGTDLKVKKESILEEPYYVQYGRFLCFLEDEFSFRNYNFKFDTLNYELDTTDQELCPYYKNQCNGAFDTTLDIRPVCFVLRCIGGPPELSQRSITIDTFTNRKVGSDNNCFNKGGIFSNLFLFAKIYNDTLYNQQSKQIVFAKKFGFDQVYKPTYPAIICAKKYENLYDSVRLEAYRSVINRGIDIFNRTRDSLSHYLVEFDLGISDEDCLIEETDSTRAFKLYFSNKGLRLTNYPYPVTVTIDKNSGRLKNPVKWNARLEKEFRERVHLLGNNWLVLYYSNKWE